MIDEVNIEATIEDLTPWEKVKFLAETLAYFGWNEEYIDMLYELSVSECKKERGREA